MTHDESGWKDLAAEWKAGEEMLPRVERRLETQRRRFIALATYTGSVLVIAVGVFIYRSLTAPSTAVATLGAVGIAAVGVLVGFQLGSWKDFRAPQARSMAAYLVEARQQVVSHLRQNTVGGWLGGFVGVFAVGWLLLAVNWTAPGFLQSKGGLTHVGILVGTLLLMAWAAWHSRRVALRLRAELHHLDELESAGRE